jgi:hypothetical protein
MDDGETRLERIEAKLDAEAKSSKTWRKLNHFTDTLFAMGLFVIGAAIASFAGIGGTSGWRLLLNIATGAVLSWLGFRLITTPVQVKDFFLNNEAMLESFVNLLDDPKGTPTAKVREWSVAHGDRAVEVHRALRRGFLAVRMGFAYAALLSVIFAGMMLGLSYISFANLYGAGVALGAHVALVVLSAVVMVLSLRGSKKNRPQKKAAARTDE